MIDEMSIQKQKDFTWEEFNQIEPQFRKKRWEEFKMVFPEYAVDWELPDGCEENECKYQNDGWCDYTDFPCGYNPFLTPRTGCLGMACMGCVPDKS